MESVPRGAGCVSKMVRTKGDRFMSQKKLMLVTILAIGCIAGACKKSEDSSDTTNLLLLSQLAKSTSCASPATNSSTFTNTSCTYTNGSQCINYYTVAQTTTTCATFGTFSTSACSCTNNAGTCVVVAPSGCNTQKRFYNTANFTTTTAAADCTNSKGTYSLTCESP